MSAGLIPDEGIGFTLEMILRAPITGVVPWSLWLFTNDIEPTYETVVDDLEQATWDGYATYSLTRELWSTPEVVEGCATSVWGEEPITYFVGVVPPLTINYGAAYVDESRNEIRWIQRFDDADLAPLQSGGKFLIWPFYTLTSAECEASMLAARRRARRKRK